ncbi:MAG: HAD family hydrolase [Rickettsiales bacterium]|jgi:phosphoglycolate phosphatase-like HAD superfamily hydrolase|nr:HAD family hydrolase [Rickettsiales bacterium]
MTNLYIFDFDGTIADTKSLVKKGLIEYSEQNNLPLPDVETICYGYSNPDLYDFKWGVDKERQKELMDKAFIMITNKIANMEYIPELFNNCKKVIKGLYEKGHTLSICTSREKEAVIQILKHYDLEKYFTSLRTREDVKIRDKKPKPNPELILEIIDELNFDKKNTYIIGDTDADIQGGKNAKIKTIGVTWGYFSKQDMEKLEPDYIIEDFSEVSKF